MTNKKQWKIRSEKGPEIVVETERYAQEGFLMDVSVIDILLLVARQRREHMSRRAA